MSPPPDRGITPWTPGWRPRRTAGCGGSTWSVRAWPVPPAGRPEAPRTQLTSKPRPPGCGDPDRAEGERAVRRRYGIEPPDAPRAAVQPPPATPSSCTSSASASETRSHVTDARLEQAAHGNLNSPVPHEGTRRVQRYAVACGGGLHRRQWPCQAVGHRRHRCMALRTERRQLLVRRQRHDCRKWLEGIHQLRELHPVRETTHRWGAP